MSDAQTTVPAGKASIASSLPHFDPVKSIGQFWANVRVRWAETYRKTQIARMKSILMSMSDHQLEQIDIKRTDIGRYAESLMSGE